MPADQSTPEVTRAGSLDYRISWPRPATPCNLQPLWKGEFASFDDWCNFASKRLTGTNNGRSEVKAICVDALGRRCSDGCDFMRGSCPSTWCNFRCATGPHRSGGLGCNL